MARADSHQSLQASKIPTNVSRLLGQLLTVTKVTVTELFGYQLRMLRAAPIGWPLGVWISR